MTGPADKTDWALFEHDDYENGTDGDDDAEEEREQAERDNYREIYAEDSERYYY